MSGALTSGALVELVREALLTGDVGTLAAAYADDGLLEVSVQGERSLARGSEAIAVRLERLWPGSGRLVEWAPTPGPRGSAVWSERVAEDGSCRRQRQYLQLRDGAIARHWVFGAPPRSAAPELAGAEAPALFERLAVNRRQPLVSTGWSGNRLERVRTVEGRTLIAKRIDPSADWIGRNSRDRGREGLLYAQGLFQRMSGIDPAVVAAEPEGDDAWWVVIALAAPKVAERERDAMDLLPKQFEAAWEAFAEAIESDVAEAVLALLDDPSQLVSELESLGSTPLHGDLRDEQIGFGDDALIVLDWGLATQGHPVVDLAWYMVHDVWRIEATHVEVVEDFRRARGDHDDPRAVDLLVGH